MTESAEICPHVHGQLIFDKMQMEFKGERIVFKTKMMLVNVYIHMQRKQNSTLAYNSKWIIDLSVKQRSMKDRNIRKYKRKKNPRSIKKKNTGENLCDLSLAKISQIWPQKHDP